MDATRPRTRPPAGRGGSYGSRSVQRNLVGFARLVAGFGSAVGRPIWGCVAPTPIGDGWNRWTAAPPLRGSLDVRGFGQLRPTVARAAYRPTVASPLMPQTRAERLAQRAAERRARVEQQATNVEKVGDTAAARAQQQDDYKQARAESGGPRARAGGQLREQRRTSYRSSRPAGPC